jgi:hypothetical protein
MKTQVSPKTVLNLVENVLRTKKCHDRYAGYLFKEIW